MHPSSLELKCRVITTGPPGKSFLFPIFYFPSEATAFMPPSTTVPMQPQWVFLGRLFEAARHIDRVQAAKWGMNKPPWKSSSSQLLSPPSPAYLGETRPSFEILPFETQMCFYETKGRDSMCDSCAEITFAQKPLDEEPSFTGQLGLFHSLFYKRSRVCPGVFPY